MLVTSLLNIIFSIILGKIYGVSGIVIATGISRLLTTVWYEPRVLYKKVFNKKVINYFKLQSRYCICTIITFFLCYYICKNLYFSNLLPMIIVKIIIICITSTLIFTIINIKTDELYYWFSFLKKHTIRRVKDKHE